MNILDRATQQFYKLKWKAFGEPRSFEDFFLQEEQRSFRYSISRARAALGYDFNLSDPRSFNEKLVHRRLFSRDRIWPIVTDKIGVREWCERNRLTEIVNLPEVIGVYDRPENVPHTLFGKPIVLKAAWASGLNLFLDDHYLSEDKVWKLIEKWHGAPYATSRLIWASHRIPRRFIAEKKFPLVHGVVPPDYKFFVFGGEVAFCQIDMDRFQEHSRITLGRDGMKLPFEYKTKSYPGSYEVEMDSYWKMVKIAEKVGEDFDFIRVDLFLIEGKIMLGELTQTPHAGFGKFSPTHIDFELGEKWDYDPASPSYTGQY